MRRVLPLVLLGGAFVIGGAILLVPERGHPPTGTPSPAVPGSQRGAADPIAALAGAPVAELPDRLRALVAEPPSAASTDAFAAAISRWLETSPADFRAFVDQLAAMEGEGDPFRAAFFDRLVDALPLLTDRAASSAYLAELLRLLVAFKMEADPATALAWAERWLLDDALDSARVAAVTAIAAKNPVEALALLVRIEGPRRKLEAVAALGDAYARADPEAALAWGKGLGSSTERAVAMNGVLIALAEALPERARREHTDFAASVQAEYRRSVAAERIARGLPAEPGRDAQGNVIVDDAGGEALPPEHSPDLELLADAGRVIASALASRNLAEAIAWVEAMPPTLAQTESTRALLTSWAEQDPAGAFRYFQQRRPDDAEAAAQVFTSWATRDPEVAAREAARLPDAVRPRALESVVQGWIEAQPGSAGRVAAWVNELGDAGDRDEVRRALASTLDGEDSALAWELASAIGDPRMRSQVLRSTFTNLASDAPDRAESALRSAANLTPAERQRLEEILATLR